MKRRSLKRRQNRIPQKHTRYPKIIGFAIIGLIAVAIVAFQPHKPTASPETMAVRNLTPVKLATGDSHGPILIAKLEKIVAEVRMVAKGDKFAEALAEKFAIGARAAYPSPTGGIELVRNGPAPPSDDWLMFIFVANNEIKYVPLKIPSYDTYFPHLNGILHLYVPGEEANPIVEGVTILHELNHWNEYFFEKMRYNDLGTEERAKEELRAHKIQYDALDRVTGGNYSKMVAEVLKDPKLKKPLSGHPNLYEPTEAGLKMLEQVLDAPAKGSVDQATRDNTFGFGVILAQGKTVAEQVRIYMSFPRANFNQ